MLKIKRKNLTKKSLTQKYEENYNKNLAFCYVMLPRFIEFFKDHEFYYVLPELSSDNMNMIQLIIKGRIPRTLFERMTC
jgi:hypothetical protein